MGGLVAREAIENPRLDPGNVRTLIMIAVPNHGSSLAEVALSSDVVELLTGRLHQHDVSIFYAGIEDGLNEAAKDLRPRSIFLMRLNARPRNPDTSYTVIMGSRGWMSKSQLAIAAETVDRAGESQPWVRLFGSRAKKLLNELDEVVDGTGDGIVAIESGRLNGVDDVLVLPFSHTSVVSTSSAGVNRRVRREIVARIRPGA
jgi:hypothetical protein